MYTGAGGGFSIRAEVSFRLRKSKRLFMWLSLREFVNPLPLTSVSAVHYGNQMVRLGARKSLGFTGSVHRRG